MLNDTRYIPFIKRHRAASELSYVEDALKLDLLEHGSKYARMCEQWIKNYYHCKDVIVTSSGFTALYIIMLLENIRIGDEVVISSYSCPSAMNSVLLANGTPVLCGIDDRGCIDVVAFKQAISEHTKMVILNHYGGFACDMQKIINICKEKNIIVVEDCATAMGSIYQGKLLGTMGEYAIVSFNDKKDVTAGEGGALIINKENMNSKTYIYNNGVKRIHSTNGGRGVPTWCGAGYSNKISDITAAFLYAQLLETDLIIRKKQSLWKKYYDELRGFACKYDFQICENSSYSRTNGNTFYIKFSDKETRDFVKSGLLSIGIETLAHYGTLKTCMNIDSRIKYYGVDDGSVFDSLILRLPIYTELEIDDIAYICKKVVNELEMKNNGKYSIDSKM